MSTGNPGLSVEDRTALLTMGGCREENIDTLMAALRDHKHCSIYNTSLIPRICAN